MLVLDRKAQEGLWIGERIFVKVLGIRRRRVKLGIRADSDLDIAREEIRLRSGAEQWAEIDLRDQDREDSADVGRVDETPLRSEAQYRALLAAIPDMVFRLSKEGRFLDFIPAKGQEPAVPVAEFLGRTVHQVLPADVAREALRHIKRALQTGDTQVFEYELPVPLPNGEVHDHEARIAVSGNDEVLVVARDISERKRAEEALRESEQRLRTLVTNAPVILFAIDGEGVFTVAEGRGMTPVGLRPEEHVGRSVIDLYSNTPGVIDAARRALAGEAFSEIVETENRVFEAHVTPLRGSDGAITGAVAVAAEVTERKRAEEALRESEERFRTLSEATLEGIIIDDSAECLDANPQVAAMARCELDEFIGKNPLSFVAPESRDLVREHVTGAREDFVEALALRKDGTTFPIEVRAKAAFYQGREVRVSVVRDLTERKRAEEALHEREQRLRTVVENAPVGLFAIDREGVITLSEGQAQAAMGLKAGEHVGLSMFEVYRDFPGIIEGTRRVLAGEAMTETIRVGRVVLEVRTTPIRDQDGEVTGAIGVATDITERRRAEMAARESDERLRTVVANAPVVLFAIDREGVFTVEAGKGLSRLGIEPEQDTGRSVFDLYGDVPEAVEAARRALSGDSFTTTVEREGLAFEAQCAPLRDRRGSLVGGIAVATDVTDRKQAENALRASEEMWRSLVENSPDIIMNVGPDGTILLINRTLPGFPPPEQVAGASVYEFIPPEDHDTMRGALEQAFRTGEPDSFETAGGGPHRTTSLYEVRLAPVKHDGEVASVHLIATDVTELRRAEEVLQRARDELEARVERQMEAGRAYDLSFRELTVLYLVADGRADKEIATELGISPRTANKHVENILQKMGATSRTEAGVRAVREGLLGQPD